MLSDREIRERLGHLADTSAQPEANDSDPPVKRAWWLLAVLVAAAVGLWAAGGAFLLHLGRIAPHQPDPGSGQIYAFTDLRTVLYLTAHQHTLVVAAAIVLPLFTLFTVLVAAVMASSRQSVFGGQ